MVTKFVVKVGVHWFDPSSLLNELKDIFMYKESSMHKILEKLRGKAENIIKSLQGHFNFLQQKVKFFHSLKFEPTPPEHLENRPSNPKAQYIHSHLQNSQTLDHQQTNVHHSPEEKKNNDSLSKRSNSFFKITHLRIFINEKLPN
ncbi:hypothetical protein AVEN_109472-1 [Araneus ventricosus]|uniref:Uncharacterized protein n=1 Tax=Araneus ventricosus TaxID=182803 RepID=A0A4Y2A3D1_ARAVE|nr:hypothetical protein AVEN_15369-1 [Araneus ventricosus]GBL74361.1 hypothetical protein AVEN_109472-1 [Araneus ventricosus]